MTTAIAPVRVVGEEGCSGRRRLTLEERLTGAWEALRAAGLAECPVCHGRLEQRDRQGRCGDCGSSLA